jgi:hypothetical protein
MIYICDIDGTIADLTHRLHYIGATPTAFKAYIDTTPKDWAAFHAACPDDKPIFQVISVIRALKQAGHQIVYSTGRTDDSRSLTIDWLSKFRVPVLYSKFGLYMRAYGDHREDNVVKGELLDQILKDYGVTEKDLGGAFEDRQQVVDMYRARGVKVFQVAPGNF